MVENEGVVHQEGATSENVQVESVKSEEVSKKVRKSKMEDKILESLKQAPKSELELVLEFGMKKDNSSLNPVLRKLVERGILKREKPAQDAAEKKKSSFVYSFVN